MWFGAVEFVQTGLVARHDLARYGMALGDPSLRVGQVNKSWFRLVSWDGVARPVA